MGAFHLLKISGTSSSAVNGTRFVGSSHWKIPRKSGKSKKVVPFSRLEFPNGISCSIYVSRSLYQFQVHGREPPRTGVYDQMEQLFTNRKFHFCYHRNFRVFFQMESARFHPKTDWWDKINATWFLCQCKNLQSYFIHQKQQEVKNFFSYWRFLKTQRHF